MNKRLVYLLLNVLFIAMFSCNNDENSNNKENGNDTTIQSNQTLNNKYILPEELTYTKDRQGFIYDKFYPIGWSKDGKLAYIIEPADDESGLYLFEIIIIDIVNNKVIWSWKPEESEEGNLQSTWKENYDLFAQNLEKLEITQTNNFKLEKTSTSYKGNDYELVMETKTALDPDFGIDLIKEIEISFVSPEIGTKLFFEQKIDNIDYIISAYIPGFLMCPYDDRVIVLCLKERIGIGGPPNYVSFELIGSNLIRGFKKENDS